MKIFIFLVISLFLFLFNANASGPGIVSYKVVDIDTGEVVMENNPDYALVPASNQKIITLYSAMQKLPADFTYKTVFGYQGVIKGSTLHGKLFIKFDGDPKLTSDDINDAIAFIRSLGVKSITKGVSVDITSYKDEINDGLSSSQFIFCSHAPVSAGIIDGNCQMPTLKVKDKKLFIEYPSLKAIELINKAVYKDSDKCEIDLKSIDRNTFELRESFNEKCDEMKLRIAIQDEKEYIKDVLRIYLDKAKIKYDRISFGETPNDFHPFYSIYSNSLMQMLTEMMKDSNNMIAESIFRKISAADYGVASPKKSLEITRELIAEVTSTPQDEFRMEDGAGGSRKNFISPSMLVELLIAAYKDEAIGKDFLTTFPIVGKEGTVAKRLDDMDEGAVVLAKTGTLENVSSLSGYIFKRDKKYVFSIIQNGIIGTKSQAVLLEDGLVEDVVKYADY